MTNSEFFSACVTLLMWGGLFGAVVATVVHLLRKLFDVQSYRVFQAGFEAGMQAARYELHAASWWFSEDPITRNLLADLSNPALLRDVWDVREAWRRARGEKGADSPEDGQSS